MDYLDLSPGLASVRVRYLLIKPDKAVIVLQKHLQALKDKQQLFHLGQLIGCFLFESLTETFSVNAVWN